MVIAQKIHKTTCLKIQELGAEKQVFTQLNLDFFIKYFCEVPVDINSKYHCYTLLGINN